MAALRLILNEIHYELVRKIAEGGMGVVYEALQHGTGNFRKVVAIKLIREEYSSIPEFQKNFIGEARLVADLIHTNIAQTYHLGIVGGQHFMVMELVNGVNLEQFIERHRLLGRPVPVDFARVHRVPDRPRPHLRPPEDGSRRASRSTSSTATSTRRTCCSAYEGDVKLTDFGIAKAFNLMYNEEGKVIPGKDEYCSPEQASYAVTDARADLFSLGIVLAEMLLGRNIFRADDRLQSRKNVLTHAHSALHRRCAPAIDARLDTILHKALERDRSKRYQTAFDLLTDLELYLYSDRYGPTNEKLGVYLRELFDRPEPAGRLLAAPNPRRPFDAPGDLRTPTP